MTKIFLVVLYLAANGDIIAQDRSHFDGEWEHCLALVHQLEFTMNAPNNKPSDAVANIVGYCEKMELPK